MTRDFDHDPRRHPGGWHYQKRKREYVRTCGHGLMDITTVAKVKGIKISRACELMGWTEAVWWTYAAKRKPVWPQQVERLARILRVNTASILDLRVASVDEDNADEFDRFLSDLARLPRIDPRGSPAESRG